MSQSAIDSFSFKRVVTHVLGRLVRGGKGKAVKTARCRNRKVQIPKDVDLETRAVPRRRRVLVQDGVHRMFDPAEYGDGSDSDGEGEILTNASGVIMDDELEAIRQICKATSMTEVQTLLDSEVKDDWLGGLDSFPGNIYMISALNWQHLDKNWRRGLAKRAGMLAVLIIQLLGPPVIFYQKWTGFGEDDNERLRWSAWSVSLSDWSLEEKYFLTKFIALLFLFCFIINGVFCHMDEVGSWNKVCRIVNMLNHNGEMEDSCISFLYLGAFMNAWVIFWLCIDMWLVLGVSDSVTDVLMDALALAFLYNLDDIGSDLRFVDEDDWPGLQLAWLDKYKKKVAAEYDDIDYEGTDPPEVCSLFLNGCSVILGLFSIVLPMLFIITPFKAMKPDPFFETITESMWKKATISV